MISGTKNGSLVAAPKNGVKSERQGPGCQALGGTGSLTVPNNGSALASKKKD